MIGKVNSSKNIFVYITIVLLLTAIVNSNAAFAKQQPIEF